MERISNISHVLYRVWDREKAIEFFVDVFGCYVKRRARIVYVGVGDTLLEMPVERPELVSESETDHYIFGLEVKDLDEALAECEAHGSIITRPIDMPSPPTSFWGRQAVVSIPGGLPVALREWRLPDGPHFEDWTPEN